MYSDRLAPVPGANYRGDRCDSRRKVVPAAKPKPSSPKRIPHKVLMKEILRSAMMTAAEEKMMVPLCVSREEKNPDPSKLVMYPAEIKRKNNPAWL